LIYIVIIYFIKYELDEFELKWNECLCMVWYSINVCEWCGVWSWHSIFIVSSGKEIPVLRLLRRALFGDSIYLRRYLDSTGTLDSYRW